MPDRGNTSHPANEDTVPHEDARRVRIPLSVRMIVGYSSSPGGLNGEAHMCEWIREKVTEEVFDVVAQNAEFQEAAAEGWRRIMEEPQMWLT